MWMEFPGVEAERGVGKILLPSAGEIWIFSGMTQCKCYAIITCVACITFNCI